MLCRVLGFLHVLPLTRANVCGDPPSRLPPPRALWSDGPSQGRRARSALSMAADMAAVEVAEQEEEESGDIFVSFRPLTESPVFIGVQVGDIFVCVFLR